LIRPNALNLYQVVTGVLEPVAPALLAHRARKGKEDLARLDERLGKSKALRPDGPLVWLHGASVGESLSILPLVERLRAEKPKVTVLVTSGTTTSAALLAKRLPPGALHQYVPVDAPGAARRFMAQWRPSLAVFVESELWPNLLLEAKAAGARLALVSAKLSDRSFASWSTRPQAAHRLLSLFDLILAQDARAQARFDALGGSVAGEADLKFGATPLPVDPAALAVERERFQVAPLLVASTHPGEDEIALDAIATSNADLPSWPSRRPEASRRRSAARRRVSPPTSSSPTPWARWACGSAWRELAWWREVWSPTSAVITRWRPRGWTVRRSAAPSWRTGPPPMPAWRRSTAWS
jgi:3-deoxy-D-manno-octulosonic-acid transferase